MAKFLDEAGLQRLVAKIKEKFIGETEILKLEELESNCAEVYASLYAAIGAGKPVFVAWEDNVTASINSRIEGTDVVVEYFDDKGTSGNTKTVCRITSAGTHTETSTSVDAEVQTATKDSLSLSYDAETKTIKACINGTAVGTGVDATPFIKDGMLDDVDTIAVDADNIGDIQKVLADVKEGDKVIKFVWNTDGDSKVDYIKTSDIAADPDTANTEVSADIIIAGGPLADEVKSVFSAYKDADGNTIIPKNMTLQEVLTLLVCKELFPTAITTTDATLVSTCAAPTITMSTTTVEVGTTVAYTIKNGASSYTATPHTASGFTYGYSAADDNSKDNSATSVKAAFGTITEATTQTTLTASDTVGSGQLQEYGTSAAGSATISGSMVVVEGTNTVTAQSISNTFTGTCSALPVYYGCSNTGRTNDGTKNYPSTAKEEVTLTSKATTSSSTKKSVTAQYKYFIGYSDNTAYSQFDSASVRALTAKTGNITKDGTTTVVAASATAVASNGKSVVVAVPSKYAMKTITNGLGADIMANFSSVGTVKVKVGGGTGAEVDYTVYVYPITNGAVVEYKGLTIGKA